MLQIISGKFFTHQEINNTERKVIIYSNVEIKNTVTTNIARLEPLDNFGSIPSYLLTYNNRMENNGSGIIAIGDYQIVDDFLALCSFWFQGMFSIDKDIIKELIRPKKEDFLERSIPADIIPRIFNKQYIASEEKNKKFADFISLLIGLKRDTYLHIIKAIRQYRDALLTINSNLELAYTMFVASVESLVQNFDDYQTSWNDVDEDLRDGLENILKNLNQEASDEIKTIITDYMHLKLSRRYTEFSLSNICESFYLEEATEIVFPCRKSQLPGAIINSYKIRSKYIHALKEIPKIISFGGGHEIFNDEGDVYFTFSGLSRFVRNVIITFMNKQDLVDSEDINYMDEIPNVVYFKYPSSSWIGNDESYDVKSARSYFNALLEVSLPFVTGDENTIINLMKVCDKILKLIKGVSKEQKIAMAAFYIFYNYLLKKDLRHPNFEQFLEENNEITEILTMENIILHLLTKNDFPWDIETIYELYKEFDKKRNKKNQIKIPQRIEICLLLELGNLSLNSDKEDMYKELIHKAVYENPGNAKLINYLRNLEENIKSKVIIDWEKEILSSGRTV